MLSLGIAELPVLSTRARGPTSQRYQTGDLNACDTFYRSVLPEYPNLSTQHHLRGPLLAIVRTKTKVLLSSRLAGVHNHGKKE